MLKELEELRGLLPDGVSVSISMKLMTPMDLI